MIPLINSFRYASGGASWSTANENAMAAGGTGSPWSPSSASQSYNGSSWSSESSLPASRQLLDGGGNSNNYISIGGDSSGTSNPQDDVYTWNGSSWSTAATISANTFMHSAGGNYTDAIWMGGSYSAYDTVQTFDGSSWSNASSMPDGIRGHQGDGKSDNAWSCGGYDGSNKLTAFYTWNGSSWSTSDAFDGSNGDAYGYGGGAGKVGSVIMQTNQKSVSNLYKHNGSSWALTGNSVKTAVNYSALGGDSGNCIKGGGNSDGGAGWANTGSETYDGTSWSSTGNLSTGLSGMGMGGNGV